LILQWSSARIGFGERAGLTNTGYWAGDGGIERVDDARGVGLALVDREICFWCRCGCGDDTGEDARKSEDKSELHVDGVDGRVLFRGDSEYEEDINLEICCAYEERAAEMKG
jgi:hypothetical protein